MAINKSYLVKGVIYAILLAVGIAIGAFMKSLDANLFLIVAVVSIINISATIVVFYFLKKDLAIAEHVSDEDEKSKKGSKSEK